VRRILLALGLCVITASVALACSSSEAPRTLQVPAEHPNIQDAVDAARPGDLILIAPGTYHESVEVTTERIVLRGTDRNQVILDGQHSLDNGIAVAANGVAVENLTITGYRQNGLLFSGAYAAEERGAYPGYGQDYGAGDLVIDGYRASYVTAYNNGTYGLYAFAARNGIFEHSYASGHPDSGFYVGQCRPCNVVLRNLVAERNAIGYYGTNASGDVWVVESVFRRNRLGITPNSQDAERLAPQSDTWVVGNLVTDNNEPDTPEIPMGFFGGGIAVGAGTSNKILNNRVEGHLGAGILVIPLDDRDPEDNEIRGNLLVNNRVDLVAQLLGASPGTNCFAANTFATSDPANIESLLPCGGALQPWQPSGTYQPPTPPPTADYRQIPAPAPQPQMPDALTAPARPATGTPTFPDPTLIGVPSR
jgi:hypothetical protein